MKKLLIATLLFTILFSGFGYLPVASAKGLEDQPANVPVLELANEFTFEQLGYSEKMLIGPFDSASVYFSLPANVKLAVGSTVSLTYALAWSGTSNAAVDYGVVGTMLVYFNEELIDTIILEGAGEVTKEIAIPETALASKAVDGRHQLRIYLNADINCRFQNVYTTVIISKNSKFNLQYENVTPPVDLSLLPQPIFQPDSILPSSALVVIPDNPDASELQSALTVSAGLGSITEGDLSTSLVTNGSLTPEMVSSNHLIFVGEANHFPNLSAANLRYPIGGNGLAMPQGHEGDGIIQMAVSPWSPSNVVLYIGGNSPEAVVKAGQTFSTGKVIAVDEPNVSFISTVNPATQENVTFVDRTLKELGYESQTMGLFGENYFSYLFYASPEQAASTGGYLNLIISHSGLLDYDKTGMTVILNDEVVGGVRLSEDSPTTTQIKLVPGVLRRGINRLEIFSDIVPYYTCYATDLQSTWVTINESSSIHLPVSQQPLDVGSDASLQNFPYMFLSSTNLDDLAIILPHDDPTSWASASNVAFYMGAKGSLPVVDLHAAYADDIPEELLNQDNLLTFGRSSTLPFLSEINDKLPAPFESGSDEAVQPTMRVNYSLLPDTNVGYLQLLASPFNADRTVLAVLGNTQAGIPMASKVLTQDDLVAKLGGNFGILYGDQILTTDTRLGISKDGLISELPVAVTVTPESVTAPPSQPQGQTVEKRPGWILPVIGVSTLLILAFLIFVFIREISGGSSGKKGKRESTSKDANQKPE